MQKDAGDRPEAGKSSRTFFQFLDQSRCIGSDLFSKAHVLRVLKHNALIRSAPE
jgi:hypothetical protein